jgi:hypothetical protein
MIMRRIFARIRRVSRSDALVPVNAVLRVVGAHKTTGNRVQGVITSNNDGK